MSEKRKLGFWDVVGKVARKTFTSDHSDPVEALKGAAVEVGAEVKDDVRRALEQQEREERAAEGIIDTHAEPAPEPPARTGS